MRIVVPKETVPGENRVALIPASIEKLIKLGAEIWVERNLGLPCSYSNENYQKAGAKLADNLQELLSDADVVLGLQNPSPEGLEYMKKGAIYIGHLDPFNQKELLARMASADIRAISMEMIPRTTRAQKMDALSSQASLAGYVAVTLACERLNKVFPMMTTPAGTISPSRVFVIGAGVAGLQAIATAKRLGARVEAFDTRPVVEEQVLSLGAKFVKVDMGPMEQTKQGYARQLTPEQIELQRKVMAKHCASADVVITTAQVFGRRAPLIVTEDMVAQMNPGSIIVDLAAASGGNVAGIELDREIEKGGVRLIGLANFPGRVALHASQMYSANLTNFISEFWNADQKTLEFDLSDDIIKSSLLTNEGAVLHQQFKI